VTDTAHISSLVVKGAKLHHAGRLREAEALYDEVLAHAPENIDALNLKGVIAADMNRHGDAIALFDRAIQARSANVEPLFNKAISLTALGDNAGAFAAYTEVVARNPVHADAHLKRAMLLHQMGRADAALAASKEMTERCAEDERGFYNLALFSLVAGSIPEATAAAEKARALKPASPDILGLCAEIAFARADFDETVSLAQQALALDGDLVSAHRVLGDALTRKQHYEAALPHYRRALELNPALAETRANYALLLINMGRHDDGAEEYRKTLRLQPENPAVRHGLGAALLALGNFAEGWEHYAARVVAKDAARNPSRRPLMFAPPQPGESLRILCDQGLGEQVLFASLLPDLLQITQDIHIRCDSRLQPLFARSFPEIRFALQAEKLSGTLADAARWLRPTFGSFPQRAGYLRADAQKRDALRKRYRGADDLPLVGISWMTGTKLKFAAPKSIPLQNWLPLLSQRAARFVSLQYGDVRDEVAALNTRLGSDIFADPDIDADIDIDGFAAQVAAMDLVITTSNTTAHVAGALNVPALVLVPLGFGGLWHWFIEREDSPWYPSVRLIRQTRPGDWDDVLHRASDALESFLAAWPHAFT